MAATGMHAAAKANPPVKVPFIAPRAGDTIGRAREASYDLATQYPSLAWSGANSN